jgi:hypothetical protein
LGEEEELIYGGRCRKYKPGIRSFRKNKRESNGKQWARVCRVVGAAVAVKVPPTSWIAENQKIKTRTIGKMKLGEFSDRIYRISGRHSAVYHNKRSAARNLRPFFSKYSVTDFELTDQRAKLIAYRRELALMKLLSCSEKSLPHRIQRIANVRHGKRALVGGRGKEL